MVAENNASWNSPEQFTESFRTRMKEMSIYIEPRSSVMDMGCGPMWLKNFLPPECIYYPVDYIRRDSDTIVCDFNNYEFPDIKTDVIFCGGIIEYINDYQWFAKTVYAHCSRCIASYNPVEYTADPAVRKNLDWVNSLTSHEFVECFKNAGFHCSVLKVVPDLSEINEIIAVFERES